MLPWSRGLKGVLTTKRDKWCYVLYCALWGLLLAFVIAMTVVAARLEWKEFKRLADGPVPTYPDDLGPVVTAGAGEGLEEGNITIELQPYPLCKCQAEAGCRSTTQEG